jgi:hypothetical protein
MPIKIKCSKQLRFKYCAKKLENSPWESILFLPVLWEQRRHCLSPWPIYHPARPLPCKTPAKLLLPLLSQVGPSKVITWWHKLSLSTCPCPEKSHRQLGVNLPSKALSQINSFKESTVHMTFGEGKSVSEKRLRRYLAHLPEQTLPTERWWPQKYLPEGLGIFSQRGSSEKMNHYQFHRVWLSKFNPWSTGLQVRCAG